MNVKALKNVIYDGTFHKTGDVFDMDADDVVRFERRGCVIRLLQKTELPAADVPKSTLNELPSLDAPRKKR